MTDSRNIQGVLSSELLEKCHYHTNQTIWLVLPDVRVSDPATVDAIDLEDSCQGYTGTTEVNATGRLLISSQSTDEFE